MDLNFLLCVLAVNLVAEVQVYNIKEFGKILLGIIRRISFTTYIQYRVRENSN